MSIKYIANFILIFTSLSVFSQNNLYSSLTIPDNLRQNANAVIRLNEVEVSSSEFLKAEPKVDEGRLDFLVSNDQNEALTYIEVKSVTLLGTDVSGAEGGQGKENIGYFPDAVTSRGLKHLEVLMRLKAEGQRSILFFCVPHEGIKQVRVAEHVDPAYAEKLREALAAGIEVLAYQVEFQSQGMVLNKAIDVAI